MKEMILESIKYHEELMKAGNEDSILRSLEGKKILITGANGLIASALIDVIMKWNEKAKTSVFITAMSRNKAKAEGRFLPYLSNDSFSLLIGDVCNLLNVEEEWDYIIHAAGNAHPVAFAKEPVDTMKANLIGTINLLEHGIKQKKELGKFLYISTGEIYGEAEGNSFQENTLGLVDCAKVRSCYPESKRAGETLCISYAAQFGINTGIARLGYIYGPNFDAANTRADIQFIKQASKKEAIVMKSKGLQCRSYCYIMDAIRGLLYILMKGESQNAYNVADDDSVVTIKEFAQTLSNLSEVELTFQIPDKSEEAGYSKMKREVLDSNKLKNLGWYANTELKDGLKTVLEILEELEEKR